MTLFQFPFIDANTGTWAPTRSDDYAKDCETGRDYAQQVIEFLERGGQTNFFGGIVSLIFAGGEWSGIEIGFFQQIAEYLAAD